MHQHRHGISSERWVFTSSLLTTFRCTACAVLLSRPQMPCDMLKPLSDSLVMDFHACTCPGEARDTLWTKCLS